MAILGTEDTQSCIPYSKHPLNPAISSSQNAAFCIANAASWALNPFRTLRFTFTHPSHAARGEIDVLSKPEPPFMGIPEHGEQGTKGVGTLKKGVTMVER
jgi:hypothetical protein